MKRYMPTAHGMQENGLGLFVLHDDAHRELAERDKIIAALRARLGLADALINRERGLTPEGLVARQVAKLGAAAAARREAAFNNAFTEDKPK
jgi:hypothetical protein